MLNLSFSLIFENISHLKERIVHMIVIDTNTEKDVNINEKLVDNGLATVWLVVSLLESTRRI